MPHPISLRELQLTELELLKCFDALCTRHGLRYSMVGGTLLGAVRHRGFIPWDDDVDISMPRPDYERFVAIAARELPEGYALDHHRVDANYLRPYARLHDERVTVRVAGNTQDVTLHAWIDIFPLDGMPKGRLRQRLHFDALLLMRFCYHASHFQINLHRKRPLYMRALIALLCATHFGRNWDTRKLIAKMERRLAKYPYDESETVVCFFGMFMRKEILPKAAYEGGARLPFEGVPLQSVADPDAFLRHYYGDYMTPPPQEERNEHSIIEILMNDDGRKDDHP